VIPTILLRPLAAFAARRVWASRLLIRVVVFMNRKSFADFRAAFFSRITAMVAVLDDDARRAAVIQEAARYEQLLDVPVGTFAQRFTTSGER